MNACCAFAVEIEPAIANLRRALAAAKMGNVSVMAYPGLAVLA